MLLGQRRRRISGGGALIATALALLAGPASAAGAGPPAIGEVWASSVFSSSAHLSAQVNPNGTFTTYHFDYITKAAYDANLAASKEPFSSALRSPSASDANVGSGTSLAVVSQQLFSLAPDTAYRYRIVAKNPAATTSPTFSFSTQATGGASILLDDRGWEMVSPVDKNGGQVDPPETLAGGGVLQAAADGQSVTYASSASFAGGAGAATASQYLATRTSSGWSTQNITAPLYSSSYGTSTEGTPYRLFSSDLARALLLNGKRCRGEGSDCAVPNPPLTGTDAPAGYQNYYLLGGGAFTALLGSANAGFLALDPSEFELSLAGSSPDLSHPVLSTCAALTANAVEVPLGEGCDPAQQNLYGYSAGGGLALINLLPAQSTGTPGAALAAQAGAISADGTRVYFTQGGSLYLREGATTKAVDETLGGGGSFQTASADGSVAYLTKAGHLYRYLAAGAGSLSDLTPSGGVAGVLGTSEAGAVVYFQDATALQRWSAGITTTAAPGASASDPSNAPPATGTSRVSADGTKLLFLSKEPLSGYDNKDLNAGMLHDSQVFLYDTQSGLACVSCNPTNERPVGPSTIPGAVANGSAPGSTRIYKPRSLSANGHRVFFDSFDAIVSADTNNAVDGYEWEAQGEGNCARLGGCVAQIASGKAADGSRFIDASADGSDAFVLTTGSLVSSDPGGADLYDARVQGGFPETFSPIACEGDACQPLPEAATDPTLTTLLSGPGNPAVRYPGATKRCKKTQVLRKGKCVKKHRKATHKQRKKAMRQVKRGGGR